MSRILIFRDLGVWNKAVDLVVHAFTHPRETVVVEVALIHVARLSPAGSLPMPETETGQTVGPFALLVQSLAVDERQPRSAQPRGFAFLVG